IVSLNNVKRKVVSVKDCSSTAIFLPLSDIALKRSFSLSIEGQLLQSFCISS
ncbi:hypothetical protein M153_11990002, partial [Pseudoloma neurophilia]